MAHKFESCQRPFCSGSLYNALRIMLGTETNDDTNPAASRLLSATDAVIRIAAVAARLTVGRIMARQKATPEVSLQGRSQAIN